MPSPLFSNSLEPIRTKDIITCGITNIPLNRPAKMFFLHDINDKEQIELTYTALETYSIPFERTDNIFAGKCSINTIGFIQPKIIKQIFRNFRNLHPKLDSDYRYLFWEVDTKDIEVMEKILNLYSFLRLPVYVHESMKGFHFISIRPILKEKYSWAIDQLRWSNEKYPPITLRIKPNKYIGEENTFFKGCIISETRDDDTQRLKDMIEQQDFRRIGQFYQIVWYSFENKENNKK